jgi:hypothetical protein
MPERAVGKMAFALSETNHSVSLVATVARPWRIAGPSSGDGSYTCGSRISQSGRLRISSLALFSVDALSTTTYDSQIRTCRKFARSPFFLLCFSEAEARFRSRPRFVRSNGT